MRARVGWLVPLVLGVVVAGCSDGGEPELSDFLQQWESQTERAPDYEGEPVLVDEEERIVYMDDCDLVDQATGSGGPYGPSEGEPGYASICPS